MFYEQRTTTPESPDELRAAYDRDLAAVVEAHGTEHVADETAVGRDRLERLAAGDAPDLSLEEAAQILSLGEGEPDAETIVEIACDHLLLGMSTAVLDVDAVETKLAIDLDAKEVQQKIERRAPMSFDEFVHIQYVIADSAP